MPLVSIVTPTYNHREYIAACIRSVRSQTFTDWEMIVVDDGSTDDTVEIAQGAAAGDKRIRMVKQDNVGVFRLALTYNRALALATGDYVAVLEGDDFWKPEKLERQISGMLDRPEAVLSYSDVQLAREDGTGIRRNGPDTDAHDVAELNNDPAGTILNLLYLENCIPAATVVVRRTALEKMGGFKQPEGLPLVDIPTWLELATMGPFVYVPEMLASWRWHPFQVTKSYHIEILQHVHALDRRHFDHLPESVARHIHVNARDIDRKHRSVLHRAYAQSGRFKLAQRRYGEARSDFRSALLFPGGGQIPLRIAALGGWLLGLLRTDMEWIARKLGRTHIS